MVRGPDGHTYHHRKQCRVEHAVFYRFDQDATILAVDVDDITIAGNSRRAVQRFKDQLSSRYGIKDMGNLCWLLGIGIDRDCKNRTISFSQAAYVQKIVERFSMEDVLEPVKTEVLKI